jgi:cytochrome c biogenesis protein ResB
MSRSGELSVRVGEAGANRLSHRAERLLRLLAEPRLGVGLLLVACVANAVGAALPDGAWIVRTPAYLALLGGVVVTGMATVAVRAPSGWKEWLRPRPLAASPDTRGVAISLPEGLAPAAVLEVASTTLREAGYRVEETGGVQRPLVAGVRRGWSHLAGLGAHLAVVLLVVGAGVGLAFGHETTFSLLPGDQALLDDARPGFTDAVRLDRLDAQFDTDGRPARLDTSVTFVSAGRPASRAVLQVNSPGTFNGYLVHGWTYGPAVRIQATTLSGRPLLDAAIPLDETVGGVPGAFTSLPTLGDTLGVALVDAGANRLRLTLANAGGVLDSAELQRGHTARVGPLNITVEELTSYVTFLSRRDPGMGTLFAGAALLVASLVIALWLPRRRATARVVDRSLTLLVRGARRDDVSDELAALEMRIRSALEEAAS